MPNASVIVNFSGGVDSTVAVLETLKNYPHSQITLCYQDTGAEYLETLPHIKSISKILDLPLVVLKNNEDFWELSKRRGYFPSPQIRQCTSYLKRDTFNKWLTSNYKNYPENVIVVSGIRAEESLRRSRLHEWEKPTDVKIVTSADIIWYPCLDMSKREVKERVIAEGLELHPCYEFATRCSCWCCIFHPNVVVREYANAQPKLYEKACLLEDDIKHKWKYKFGFNDLFKQIKLL